ncbi:serine hydrolase domain-containing protein [Streptomyces iconiensis]|uniref:Serine hydrolase domain-containing protein n=1 Tax=Streptomyces iconiensis TaxID=1384038 RepID=A0ABT6ZR33_9ACTN|nr:serine hydrolase domain-containing protein [Streptomyces iconiensis]MDJ1131126.1 serine hydrolase domain-containing protein [Streptomyces iconiensis]
MPGEDSDAAAHGAPPDPASAGPAPLDLPSLDLPSVERVLAGVVDQDEDVIGGLLRLDGHDGLRELTAGSADIGDTRPVDPAGSFRIGSITKPFVATLVLQLAAEGALTLDEPVLRRAPGLLPASYQAVTVRQLLQHTSGVPNYLPHVIAGPGDVVRGRGRCWEPGELVKIAVEQPRPFAPGAELGYSNTNYVVLGMLVHAVTGRWWGEELARRVLGPLGLTATRAPGHDPELPRPHASGYTRPDGGGGSTPVDITVMEPSVWDAAGSMISTARDLDTFLTALLAGDLVPEPLLDTMLAPFPGEVEAVRGFGFGLGVQSLRVSGPYGERTVYGGGGAVRGYANALFATRDGARRVVCSLNIAAADEMRVAPHLVHIVRTAFG